MFTVYHLFSTDDTIRMFLELFRCRIWKSLMHVRTKLTISSKLMPLFDKIFQREPKITNEVHWESVVHKDNDEKDNVQNRSRRVDKEFQIEFVDRFVVPLSGGTEFDEM